MKSVCVYVFVVALLAGPTSAFVANATEHGNVVSLPGDIVDRLRERNPGGRGGCPESNIFVHGFHFLSAELDRTIWFLGAPDYLCETNSFISVIATSGGKWTAGKTIDDEGLGSSMLAGVPILFQHSSDLGFFLTTEWQAEGPLNFMYYSADGVSWKSVDLPPTVRKAPGDDCCYAASIRSLCVADSGLVFIAYDESNEFRESVWSTSTDGLFPAKLTWSRQSKLPNDVRCDGVRPGDFMPRSLRTKTGDGAIFDVSTDWAVRIPGPTR